MLEETNNILSRTLGQCPNATNSSGKNAYRTFLKYLQVSFNLSYVPNPGSTLIITLNNDCILFDVIVASPNPASSLMDTGVIR